MSNLSLPLYSTGLTNENFNSNSNVYSYNNNEMLMEDKNDVSKDCDFFSNSEENINNINLNNLIHVDKVDKTNMNVRELFNDENFSKCFDQIFDVKTCFFNNVEDVNMNQNKNKTTEINPKKENQSFPMTITNVKLKTGIIKINNRINSKSTSQENLNKKKKRNNFFKIINNSFKYGNNFPRKKAIRKQNMKQKIVRNFIQELIPSWIYGRKPTKNERLNRDDIIKNYKNDIYKYKKLSFFLSKKETSKKDTKNDSPIKSDNIKIKLEFNLRESFLCFASPKLRDEILSTVLSRLKLYDKKIDPNFFLEFDIKDTYINSLAESQKDLENLKKSFSELIEEFNSSESEKDKGM